MTKFKGMMAAAVIVLAAGSARAEGEKMDNTAAKFKTNQGSFTVKLFANDAPKTVENFVGLANGTKEFVDMKTGQKTKRRFYDGIIFHRVISDFMIQGGDPTGTGRGGPGYQFEDEFKSGRKFDKVGILAMANAGPGTNGSQFFITVVPTPFLNNKHTIFGEVIEGYDVVEKISKVPRDGNDRPLKDVVIERIDIVTLPAKVEKTSK
jgi:peptidyl-prolyl cis-trans isomerase A (cyclophilin A)